MTKGPEDNPKHHFGNAKPGLHTTPPIGLLKAGRVHDLGAKKYGPFNWRETGVVSSVYYNAAMRHLMSWWDGEDLDPESGEPHLAHVIACMNILIDAKSINRLKDDRPIPGDAPRFITHHAQMKDLELMARGSSMDDPGVKRRDHGMSAEDIQKWGDTI